MLCSAGHTRVTCSSKIRGLENTGSSACSCVGAAWSCPVVDSNRPLHTVIHVWARNAGHLCLLNACCNRSCVGRFRHKANDGIWIERKPITWATYPSLGLPSEVCGFRISVRFEPGHSEYGTVPADPSWVRNL